MAERLKELFARKTDDLLSLYFTAGIPDLHDTLKIVDMVEKAGVDFIEIGFPYSDPVADGTIIQAGHFRALNNGMNLNVLFDQLKSLRPKHTLPVLLMGYFNVVLQYGVEAFCKSCQEVGVDAVILPDLPLVYYQQHYQSCFKQYGLDVVFLITPQTSTERIKEIDSASDSFLYIVSVAGTTGSRDALSRETTAYLERLQQMKLANPMVVGFGISNRAVFEEVCRYARGGIIGSRFMELLQKEKCTEEDVRDFVANIRG